ncbi:hypothetical protein JOE38_002155 [Clavibacter michiganensis]|nr:hypothetical protein [Clavibacter michiganensis]
MPLRTPLPSADHTIGVDDPVLELRTTDVHVGDALP